ncbi:MULTISPECIES: hypothetical protein [Bacillaceae]|uniref:Small peptidoglycan-associated lipoprotein n=1 Tax=Metabacillus endolithicus TaxID=1535204 RepID=A0ABW5BSC5_9BACI|nr:MULTISPECIES: hypothetical protein [Bacillaceae]MCM3160333.1 hypothetical protein [Metabacillus litoralis]MCM3408918.1 hypothetical protein [Metabacillus litoralis]PGT81763.1 hypothetical protein COD11_16965 [Bacillus sp. AFS040349]UGB32510.1 hypothetical protein LPC09_08805 [Metabacillus sp. B2-18]UHA59440.1 hypothetical protein KDJ21_022050 [Metabacillus litoralis]
MKRSILIAFIIPVIVLSSCENLLFSEGPLNEDIPQDKQLVFFSDDENIQREAVYYDALLDIKKNFPEEFENMKIISEKTDHNQFEIETFPSLLVIDKKQVLVQIEGTVVSKEDILEPVSSALSK